METRNSSLRVWGAAKFRIDSRSTAPKADAERTGAICKIAFALNEPKVAIYLSKAYPNIEGLKLPDHQFTV